MSRVDPCCPFTALSARWGNKDIDGSYDRRKWVVWEENGRYPDVIIELLSPSTAKEDLGTKKQLYAQTFHTLNYFCYDPDRQHLQGWRMTETGYDPLAPDVHGRLWSAALDAWVGTWTGGYQQQHAVWLRLFDAEGNLIPTEAEAAARSEAETRAEDLATRLATMEAELRRLQGEEE